MDGKNKTESNAVMRKITELKEKQEIALGILLYLDEVCRKHHLIYFAADGTLLGLIRHQGSFRGMMMWMSGCRERIMKNWNRL